MTTLAFFHGWGASGRIWAGQVAAFGHRVTVLTPTVPVWEAGWFSNFLRKMPLRETLLVGWSLGGMLLLEALSGLTDPSPGGWSWWGWPRSLPGGRITPGDSHRAWCGPCAGPLRKISKNAKNPQPVLAEFAEQCLAPGEAAFASQARQAFVSQAGPETLAAGLDYLLVQDLRPLLPGLPAGAVVIQGQEDRIVDPAQGEFLTEHLAGARLNLLPGAGHLPFLTQAAAFNGILEQCLSTAS